MKTMKRLIGVLLLLVFAFGISIPTFGEMQIGSLTIYNTNEEESYTLYRVFDLTFSSAIDTTGEGNHAYTINEDFKAFFTNEKLAGFEGDSMAQKAIAYVEARENDLADFATELQQYIAEKNIPATKIVAGQKNVTVVENLEYGYYLLVPKDELLKNGLSALFSLDTVKPNAQISNKSQYPTIEKAIVENNVEVDANNVAIGDMVEYKLSSFVPAMSGYDSYTFYITDCFDAGLTFQDDVSIKLVKEDAIKELVKNLDFTVIQEGQEITISFVDFIQYKSTPWQGADIVVTYSAVINENAVVGATGNNNTVTLTYSSNPADNSQTKTTIPEVVSSYIASVLIRKVNNEKVPLPGAKFQISGTQVNKVRVHGNQLVANAAGTYYKLLDGSYTQTVPTTQTETLYESTSQKYAMEYKESVQEQTDTFLVNAYVDANGQLLLEGLSEGEYEIKEIIAPNGYHLLAEPIIITVACTEPAIVVDGTESCVWAVSLTNPNDEEVTPTVENDIITVTIENKTGKELPFTGGVGTTLFTIIGVSLIMSAAIVVVVVNRRKRHETK